MSKLDHIFDGDIDLSHLKNEIKPKIKTLFQKIVEEVHLAKSQGSTGEYYDELEKRIKEL